MDCLHQPIIFLVSYDAPLISDFMDDDASLSVTSHQNMALRYIPLSPENKFVSLSKNAALDWRIIPVINHNRLLVHYPKLQPFFGNRTSGAPKHEKISCR